jgi:hypothetical protein
MSIKATLYTCSYCKDHCEKVIQSMEDLVEEEPEIDMGSEDIKEIINNCAYILCEAMFNTEKEAIKHEKECRFNPNNKICQKK